MSDERLNYSFNPSRRRLRPSLLLSVGMLLLALPSSASKLDQAVKVGSTSIGAREVGLALAQCHAQAADLSRSDCLMKFWVPRWLLNEEARFQELATQPAMIHRKADLLHRRLAQALGSKGSAPTSQEIDKYLKDNQRDFQKPLRVRVFRILLATEEEALIVQKSLGPDTSIEQFRKLARKNSVDHATHERGGDLGFLWPDGSTDVPQVSADRALYQSALLLSDGEIGSQLVKEGKQFAIIWRRGSKAALSPNTESRRIARLRVSEKKQEKAITSLLLELKQNHERDRKDSLLGKLRRKEATLFQEP